MPIHLAAGNGYLKVLEFLLSQCNSHDHVNAQDSVSFWTWIYYLKTFCSVHTFCDVQNGVTPLMMACSQGKEEAVELLLQSGADPNVLDQVRHAVDLNPMWHWTVYILSI